MPSYWLLKTEPSVYSYDDLAKEKKTVWDGVSNNLALKNIRSMRTGDLAFVYHSGEEKAVVGIAEITGDPYPDPKDKTNKLVVMEVKSREKLNRPVSLKEIKAQKAFADFVLVRVPRLSVMPVSKEQWEKIVRMGEEQ